MAHLQQQVFCRSVKAIFPEFFCEKLVIDIGSLDINGNNQEYFENCQFMGIDIAQGRNVDLVSKGHELQLPNESIDTIISTECFEHDQYYDQTIKNCYRMLKPGGLFVFTCATTGRPEHGTRRTTPQDAPFLQTDMEWSDYYKNLTEADVRAVLDVDKSFSVYEFSTNETSHDLYFYGIKVGDYKPRNDYSFLIRKEPDRFPYAQCYWDTGMGFCEENSISLALDMSQTDQELSFDLPNVPIVQLRLDPIAEACVVELKHLMLERGNGEMVDLLPKVQSNSHVAVENCYYFSTQDPQFSIPMASDESRRLVVGLHFVKRGDGVLQATLATLQDAHLALSSSHLALEEDLQKQHIQVNQLTHELEITKQSLASVFNSRSWKITEPLRRLFALLKA